MKAVGLALSGGAAASAAHVGVIRAFEEAGYVITHMSGTSGGALVAGLWAAGYGGRELRHLLNRLERRHFDVDWKSLARRRLLRHRGEWLGFFRASRLERWLASLTDFRQVRDLLRPVALSAVDLTRGREVIFASRPLGDVGPPSRRGPTPFQDGVANLQYLTEAKPHSFSSQFPGIFVTCTGRLFKRFRLRSPFWPVQPYR
ncbi:MAG: patatin-like phospholipase family protein [Kyrpidia tusciae]|nr:patatin-like phospholipase family protein [Kyrpidia tusciae]MBE3552758.1 patatin-like phospholipase family protein [Kyrpidia tusciae]